MKNKVDGDIIIDKVMPGFIVIALWLNGLFYPILLVPILYVMIFEKRGPYFLGIEAGNLLKSLFQGVVVANILAFVHVLISLYDRSIFQVVTSIDWYVLFLNILWFPLYEEITYRGFFLSHFTKVNDSAFSSIGFLANILQTALFVTAPHRLIGISQPLVLMPFLLLGILNGIVFERTRNITGCILSHSVLNCVALILPRILS